jgi:rare lipoprotein A
MRVRTLYAGLLLFLVYGCATSAPKPMIPEVMKGIASWYGEEFAGRTTANGEIFDPLALTAAHRTLPFGTVLEVLNRKTSQAVVVRINDRGPYVGKRVLDLSYAAAQQIGLIEPGSGEVEMKVVRIGKGEREAPAPYVVSIDEPAEKVVIAPGEPPKVPFPLPNQSTTTATTQDDFSVIVVEEQRGVPTRRQVGADGRTIENVPIAEAPVPPAQPPTRTVTVVKRAIGKFFVQVGAFSVETNARALQQQLARIGQQSYIDREELYRVRIGPFDTRDQAVKTRSQLETSGLSAIIVAE